ncbi:MAG: hypothetical protein AB7I08_07780 [Thermoleophilia bacterium]
MDHSGGIMWACAAVVAVAVLLAFAFTTPFYLLFVLPCAVMLGAMMWMMRGGGSRRNGG